MISKKPILLAGAHRSGTTWVGRMIAESPLVGYIDEPFNLLHPLGICAAKFDYWFQYISRENESIFYEHIKNTIGFSYDLVAGVKTIRCRADLWRILRQYTSFLKCRISNVRPLIKDPIAVFSAEWLASTFDMDVIVLIRHPAAFTSSLKRLNWTIPFSHFLEQPLLMKDHLSSFEAEVREYADKEHDVIEQATLFWRLIYHMVINYQKNHNDWIFIRHEDLSRDPLRGFQTLFNKLNLEFTEHVGETIKEYTDSANPSEAPEEGQSLKLDSKLNIWNWKSRLAVSEIERIRTQVEDISSVFYSDEDW
jgi:hypothetical protein